MSMLFVIVVHANFGYENRKDIVTPSTGVEYFGKLHIMCIC